MDNKLCSGHGFSYQTNKKLDKYTRLDRLDSKLINACSSNSANNKFGSLNMICQHLELKTVLPCSISKSFYASMVRITTTVKGDPCDALFQARLGNDFTHFFCHILIAKYKRQELVLKDMDFIIFIIYERNIYKQECTIYKIQNGYYQEKREIFLKYQGLLTTT